MIVHARRGNASASGLRPAAILVGEWLEHPIPDRRERSDQGQTPRHQVAFTLHDVDRTRLLGFDNAHGVPRAQTFDHRHRFRRTTELVAYDFRGADELISDFFAAVEQACRSEGAPFEFEAEETDYEMEEADDPDAAG